MAVTNPYNRRYWVDRDVQFPGRRLITPASGGQPQDVYVTRNEGTVAEEGDIWNKDNMDDMEQRIYDAIQALTLQINNEIAGIGTTINNLAGRVSNLEARMTAVEGVAQQALTRANNCILKAGDSGIGTLYFGTNNNASIGPQTTAGGNALNIQMGPGGSLRGTAEDGSAQWSLFMGSSTPGNVDAWLDWRTSGQGLIVRDISTTPYKAIQAASFDVVTATRSTPASEPVEIVQDDGTTKELYQDNIETQLIDLSAKIEKLLEEG